MNDRTFRALEYDKIIDMLTSHTVSAPGREMAQSLVPYTDRDKVISALAETEEALRIMVKYGMSPLGEFPDIRSHLRRVEKRAILSPEELLEIGRVLRTCASLKEAFKSKDGLNDAGLTVIPSLVYQLKPHSDLMSEIFRCIEPDGRIADGASPELHSIRRNIVRCQEKIKELLNGYIQSPQYQKFLQEPIVTIRNGRYVIPVKQEYRSNVPGLVHDQSASGATLFIEPMPVVEANNKLREWMLKEEQEIERILARLTEEVWKVREDIRSSFEILSRLDFIFAKGKLGHSMRGVVPRIVEGGKVNIVNGRHPLIPHHEVVPISLNLGYDFNTLVITGPNTGGKTVTLKTVGLFVLMAQAGLCLPADYGTEIGIFQKVFADIGDEQSIEQNLSTFSSHMVNIISMINSVDGDSLVLLDELGAGTDPTEGAALAMAILEFLHNSGAKTVATTHYSQLKAFAMMKPGMENASMEFDVETLSPTFRLLIGVPGKSNAFQISRRLGLKEDIIEKAREFLTQEDIRFEDLISDLEYNRTKAREEREKAIKYLKEVEKERQRLAERESELESARQQILRKAREEARMILRQAKEEADQIIKELNRLSQVAAEKERNRAIEQYRMKLKQSLDRLDDELSREARQSQEHNESVREVRLGETVYISTLGQKGQVLTLPDDNGEITVQVGIMKVAVKLSDIRRVDEGDDAATAVMSAKKPSPRMTAVSPEIDLRGQTVDEALLNVDKYLDDAFLAGLKQVTIIHGKGTGALREGIHQYLRHHPHVSSFRLGKYGEGESGVTIVELK
ncbi:endonuclease MutS2 [Caldicoprobacter faecalis]|uniref:Endonuclease MutS2 n=1 Tax=Caldicoprobacter faecalis TaxID=937334 RepID=A0A1I5S853_9FIRM|nr:endonuclease MutS2 [Caldicoprobacter faecalis]SFP66869.1 DNA mismatch repair protein MutS2 [Caldicoprobacter faecalis]